MHYYRGRMKMRCSKRTFVIAFAYDEGLGTIMQQDWEMTEKYYQHCIMLAYDDEDKVVSAGIEQAETYIGKFNSGLNRTTLAGTLMEVSKCLVTAIDYHNMNQLEDLLAASGARSVYDAALLIGVEFRDHEGENELSPEVKEELKHMFGTCAEDVEILFRSIALRNRRWVSS